jgi:tetratricopeptide (TPR) repeat protein
VLEIDPEHQEARILINDVINVSSEWVENTTDASFESMETLRSDHKTENHALKDEEKIINKELWDKNPLESLGVNEMSPELGKILHLASVAIEGRNFSEAYRYFTMAIELDPKIPFSWYGKGVSAAVISTLDTPRFDEAITCLNYAVTLGLDPEEWMEVTTRIFAHSVLNYAKIVITLVSAKT